MKNAARQITVTKAELADALRRWDAEAEKAGWPERKDDERFADNADYLMDLIENK